MTLQFDRERLAAALVKAKIDASEKNIKALDRFLNVRQLIYLIEKNQPLAMPSKELVNLHCALRDWLKYCIQGSSKRDPGFLFNHEIELVTDGGDEAKHQTILWFFSAVTEAIEYLEKTAPGVRQPAPATKLFRGLYDGYCQLNGGSSMSDTGPSIRFVIECAKIIDPEITIPLGLRQRIQASSPNRSSDAK
jgi:hypothetical protein